MSLSPPIGFVRQTIARLNSWSSGTSFGSSNGRSTTPGSGRAIGLVLAALLGRINRKPWPELIVRPETVIGWHRALVRRRWATFGRQARFFIELASRQILQVSVPQNPTGPWVTPQARNLCWGPAATGAARHGLRPPRGTQQRHGRGRGGKHKGRGRHAGARQSQNEEELIGAHSTHTQRHQDAQLAPGPYGATGRFAPQKHR